MNRHIAALLCSFFLLLLITCKPDKAGSGKEVVFKRTENEVIIRQIHEPNSLNPLLFSTAIYDREIYEILYQYLITVDPENLTVQPQLLTALPKEEEITDGPYSGGIAYEMEIRPEAVWDDGKPVTAADYEFSLKVTFNPHIASAQRFRQSLENIKEVVIDPNNPKKFTVLTNQKHILGYEAVGSAVPVAPAHILDPDGLLTNISFKDLSDPSKFEALKNSNTALKQFAENFQTEKFSRDKNYLVGSGPYRLEEWITGERVVLAKKENWWGEPFSNEIRLFAAYPDRLIYRPISDDAATLAATRSEELDVIPTIKPADFREMQKDSFILEHFELFTPPTAAYFNIYLNTKSPKLADKRVRRALAHSIDVDEIIQNVYEGFGQRTALPMPPNNPVYPQDIGLVPFNLDKAKELLASAGWSDSDNDGIADKELNGKKTPLRLVYTSTAGQARSEQVALLIQNNLRKAGIDMVIEPKDFQTGLVDSQQGKFELQVGGRSAGYVEAWDPKQDWHTQSIGVGDNRPRFGNAESDKLIDEIRQTLDPVKRKVLTHEFLKIIYEEQPCIFLFSPTERVAISKRFNSYATIVRPGYFPMNFSRINAD